MSEAGTLDAQTVNALRESDEGIRVFWSGRGIWTDKARTAPLAADGVTVGVLHTGRSYADDLLPDGIVYHYPRTKVAGKDRNEVSATKAAMSLGLPIFVVVQPDSTSRRVVHLGWVEGFDDSGEIFLITFSDDPPVPPPSVVEESREPFRLVRDVTARKLTSTATRPGQARFSFRVIRRYGAQCAVCDVAIKALLDAAHLRPYRDRGSDDPRNGLVFCATHHRAFDQGFFGINPVTLEVVLRQKREALAITRQSIRHLDLRPDPSALEWCWVRFEQT